MSSNPSILPRLSITIPVEEEVVLSYGEGNNPRELHLDELDIVVTLNTAGNPVTTITARGTRLADGDLLPDSRTFLQMEELPLGIREIVQEQVQRLTSLVRIISQESEGAVLLSMPAL